MPRPFSYRATWRELLGSREAVLARIAVSLAAAGLLTAVALTSAWIVTLVQRPSTTLTFTVPRVVVLPAVTAPTTAAVTPAPAPGSLTFLRVAPDDQTVALALVIAAALWLIPLFILWRPRPAMPFRPEPDFRTGRSRFGFALAGALLIGAAAAAAASTIEHTQYMPGDKRYLQTIVFVAAVGLLILLWLPALRLAPRTRDLLDPDGQVAVRCPKCDYRLIGLKQLRCPECGMEFTIDELIRAQKFARTTST